LEQIKGKITAASCRMVTMAAGLCGLQASEVLGWGLAFKLADLAPPRMGSSTQQEHAIRARCSSLRGTAELSGRSQT
jgi:hypothetical protein